MAETHARFPDYFFSRAILARYYVRDKRLEEARVLLDGLMQEERLHISEFRVLARAQMDYSLALGETDSALSWLEMWRGMEEDNRELVQWEARIKGSDGLLDDLLKLIARSS